MKQTLSALVILALAGCDPSAVAVPQPDAGVAGSEPEVGREAVAPEAGPEAAWAPTANASTSVADSVVVPGKTCVEVATVSLQVPDGCLVDVLASATLIPAAGGSETTCAIMVTRSGRTIGAMSNGTPGQQALSVDNRDGPDAGLNTWQLKVCASSWTTSCTLLTSSTDPPAPATINVSLSGRCS